MNADFLTDVLTEVGAYYGGTGSPVVQRLDTRQGQCSEVSRLELVLDGEIRTVYVKRDTVRNKSGDPVKSDVTVEYEVLSELFGKFDVSSGTGVVRPIAILPAHDAIITEEAPGRSLMKQIGRSTKIISLSTQQHAVENYCWLSGKWLSHFQSVTFKEIAEFGIDRLVQYCEFRLNDLTRLGDSRVDRNFRDKFVSYLSKQYEKLPKNCNRITGCHNDFSPHNIVMYNNSIRVLDFSFFNYDSFIYDVYRFWYKLECMKVSPLINSKKVSRLQRQFLHGCGIELNFQDPLVKLAAFRFNLMRMYAMSGHGRWPLAGRFVDQRSSDQCYDWIAREIGIKKSSQN